MPWKRFCVTVHYSDDSLSEEFQYNEDKYRNIGLPDRLDIAVSEKRFMGGYTDPVNDVYPQDICDICNIFTILLHYREKIEQ